MEKKNVENKLQEKKMWTAYGLALTLGYMIVVPILVFGVGGVMLDKYLDSFPIFIFLGFIIALPSARPIVYVTMKDIIIMGTPKKDKKNINKDNK